MAKNRIKNLVGVNGDGAAEQVSAGTDSDRTPQAPDTQSIDEYATEDNDVQLPADPEDAGEYAVEDDGEYSFDEDSVSVFRVPVRKPKKGEWFRTPTDEKYGQTVYILQLGDDKEDMYCLHPDVAKALAGEATIKKKRLIPTITSQGVLIRWPLRLRDADGKLDAWGESEMKCMSQARKGWRRMTANMGTGSYNGFTSKVALKDPKWPNKTIQELVKVAFSGRFINTLDHPILKQLGDSDPVV